VILKDNQKDSSK